MKNTIKYQAKHNQKGGTLLFALIALVIMLLGSVSLYKATHSAVSTVGAVAFKESSIQAGNVALNTARGVLASMTDFESQTQIYYPIQRKTTDGGLPCSTPVDTSITCAKSDLTWNTPTPVGIHKVSYIIERLCKNAPDVDPTKVSLTCLSNQKTENTVVKTYIFYRITAKVTGANNTVSFVQVTLSKTI